MNNRKLDIRKGIPLAVHILFCVVIIITPLLVMSRNGMLEYHYYIGYTIRTCILIALFYVNYLVLIDRFLFKKQFFSYVIINILLVAGILFLQNLLFDFFVKPPLMRKPDMPRPPHELRILGDYVLIILAIGMSVALKVTVRWYKDSINLETIKAVQLEADLRNLRSQLNPHFLFNTLNNIYSLIVSDTQKAQESVHRLSSLLRFVLYENDQKFVPVDRELEFTQNYIDLMRLRLSPEVKLDVLIRNDNCKKQIASLLFVTLIENAFKHGTSNGRDSFIDIKIYADKEKGILCTVENSWDEAEENIETENSGIGLVNLRKRLELLYPGRHELRIKRKDNRFSVLLCVNYLGNDKKWTDEA